MAGAGGELDERKSMMTDLFNELDADKSGNLDVEEFTRFAQVLTGKKVSEEKCRKQMQRADADRDGTIDLEEWLRFGKMLNKMPLPSFKKTVKGYITAVSALRAKEKKPKA